MHTKRVATLSFVYDSVVESLRGEKIFFKTEYEWDDYIMDNTVAIIQEAIKNNTIFDLIKITDAPIS